MAGGTVPHFQNDAGHAAIDIGVKEFMCVGANPPFDHPHVFLDMGSDNEKVCPYCSTLFRYSPGLKASETRPDGCLYVAASGLSRVTGSRTGNDRAPASHHRRRRHCRADRRARLRRARLFGAALRARGKPRPDRRRASAFAERGAPPARARRHRCAAPRGRSPRRRWRCAMRASLAVLARVRLGDFAEQRWGAPYLVAHRADLHSALLAPPSGTQAGHPIVTGAAVRDFALYADGVTVSIDRDGKVVATFGPHAGRRRRRLVEPARAGRREGQEPLLRPHRLARTLECDSAEARADIAGMTGRHGHRVPASRHPPDRLSAARRRARSTSSPFTPTKSGTDERLERTRPIRASAAAMAGASAMSLAALEAVDDWTVWPIHTVAFDGPWTLGGLCADRRRRARHDALCRARCGDGNRGRRDAGRRCVANRRLIGQPALAAGKSPAPPHRKCDAARRAQPLRLARLRPGRAGAQPVPQDARRRRGSRADLDWLYGWTSRIGSAGKRQDQARLEGTAPDCLVGFSVLQRAGFRSIAWFKRQTAERGFRAISTARCAMWPEDARPGKVCARS